jgi:hypothetical protein
MSVLQKFCKIKILVFTILFSFGNAVLAQTNQMQCLKLLSSDNSLPSKRTDFLRLLRSAVNVNSFSISEYGVISGHKVLRRLRELFPDYQALAVDPGVISRFNLFMTFAKELKRQNVLPTDPWKARDLFTKKLGTKIYYRAIAINEEDLAEVHPKNGLDSKLLWNSSAMTKVEMKSSWGAELSKGWQQIIRDRFGRVVQLAERDKFSPLLSISDYPDMAVGIANSNYGDSTKDAVLLVEVEIPQLDVIEPSNNAYFKFPTFVRFFGSLIGLNSESHFSDGRINSYPYDHRVESLTFYRILPEEIHRAFLLPKKESPPTWHSKPMGTAQITVTPEEFFNEISANRIL